MRVIDRTTGQVVAGGVRPAESAWARFRGLMLRPGLAAGEGLDIRPCGSIHMCFMRFAIDAVFYDGEGRVTKVARNVRPWIGLAFGGRSARGVVELAAGAAAGVEPGHLLHFQPSTTTSDRRAA
ncbi:MAG: DUF192 domain-containing protein [Dehalococcoidia bacterium]|nr:DUF192 domain-containing protein [Dehalococcoidia bacterium]